MAKLSADLISHDQPDLVNRVNLEVDSYQITF